MGLFYYLPDFAGVFFWNLLNSATLLYAVLRLKKIAPEMLLFFFLFIVSELIVAEQNSQSNGLMAGLVILSFDSFEKGKPGRAALFLILGAYIKIFALAAGLFFLFYPGKVRFLLYAALWAIAAGALPLQFISLADLMQQYHNWQVMLASDHSQSQGYSVYQILTDMVHVPLNKNIILGSGVLILLLPLIRISNYGNALFRFFYCCMLLIWVVIFNHKAESPSYIIAMTGIALWGFSSRPDRNKTILLLLTWLCVSAMKIDIFPPKLRWQLHTDALMAIMPTVLLIVIFIGLLRIRDRNESASIKR
jgi:hypothetical protein